MTLLLLTEKNKRILRDTMNNSTQDKWPNFEKHKNYQNDSRKS